MLFYVTIHSDLWVSEYFFLKFQPIRNKNCHVSHVLLQDQNKMRNFCRRPCIWLIFALRWKSFGFVIHISGDDLKKKFSQSDTREISNGDVFCQIRTKREALRNIICTNKESYCRGDGSFNMIAAMWAPYLDIIILQLQLCTSGKIGVLLQKSY